MTVQEPDPVSPPGEHRAAETAAPSPAVAASTPAKAAWYSRWGNAAQIASAVMATLSAAIAAVGFTVVAIQLREGREKAAAEAHRAELADARRNYTTYTDSVLRHPQLSDPDYDALMRDRREYLRYQAFVGQMIYAYDDILNVLGDADGKKEWVVAFEIDIKPHRRYLCHPPDPRFFETYRPAMRRLLRDAAGDCKGMAPLVETQTGAKPPHIAD